jgi:hypothetical protein
MDIFEGTGRVTLTWDPAQPAEVEGARVEFQRLRDSGYVMFAAETGGPRHAVERRVDEFDAAAGGLTARSAVPAQTDVFDPESSRIVAVRPLRGGSGCPA